MEKEREDMLMELYTRENSNKEKNMDMEKLLIRIMSGTKVNGALMLDRDKELFSIKIEILLQ